MLLIKYVESAITKYMETLNSTGQTKRLDIIINLILTFIFYTIDKTKQNRFT